MAYITTPCKDIDELLPAAREACRAFIEVCKYEGLSDIIITETYRSQERQNYLYSQGRERPGQVVTWTKNSNHTSRQAWDICFQKTGYSELGKFYKAGAVADRLGITWGGNWKKQDLPHFQYTGDSFMLPTSYKEAMSLTDRAIKEGIITDKDLWYEYMTGQRALSAGNLRALFSKVLGVIEKKH